MHTFRYGIPVALAATLLASVPCAHGQTFTPTVEQASATWPVGTDYSGYVSTSDDPVGVFLGESVHFRGLDSGGVEQVYRIRIDFDREVLLHGIEVEGAAWAGGGTVPVDVIRLFDDQGRQISEVDALGGSSSFQLVQVPGLNTPGTTFFIEEINGDDVWRYRSAIRIDASLRPSEAWVDDE